MRELRVDEVKRAPVVSLTEVRLTPVPEVVEELRALLARAETGEIRGFVLAGVCDKGETLTVIFHGDGGVAHLNLAVDRLKARLISPDVP